ncbi:MAG: hypothetical protein K2X93_13310 [Candidatus Obscuribacterales bacterium]|nr:hypothetical protein [Candidatus Obscuribacterales bacterium]
MYVKRVIDSEIIFFFAKKPVTWTTLLSTTVFLCFHFLHLRALSIPFLPIATVGTAVAFYVGFKNNSSYDRLWEARKIWGELTNYSRALASYLISVVRTTDGKASAKSFVYRQIAYVNFLRIQLRKRNVWDDSHIYTQMATECFTNKPFEEEREELFEAFCSRDEAEYLRDKRNIGKELLFCQMQALASFKAAGCIDAYEHSDMMRMCTDLLAQQGKAERIKSFPFPRQYAFFSELFVIIFVCLLPFGLIGEFAKLDENCAWLTIPFSVLISFVFYTMEQVGDTSENPFEGSINDVPMTAICRTIEIDLKELLGESDLPAPIEAVNFVLM